MKSTIQKIFGITLLTFIGLNLNAQLRVALHHNGTTEIFGGSNPFQQAYDSAISGDTIYIPGGVFAPPANINKRLTIYGAGHYPDTTTATQKTFISGDLNIQQNADSTLIEGLELGSISIPNNHKVDYLTISRCRLTNFTMAGNQSTPCQFLTFKENVTVGTINLSNVSYSIVTNNIVQGQINYGNNNAIYNNILLYINTSYYYTRYVLTGITNTDVANNIFRLTSYTLTISGNSNTVKNNVNIANTTGSVGTYTNNYTYPIVDSIFVNHFGTSFSYEDDFHLDSAGVYLGVDSTQVGIYGGLYPWKESSVPNIPHIFYKNIPTAVEPNGSLDIEIKVNAENY